MEVVTIAKKLGFTWGGDWVNFPDYPHLQMDFGYSIRQLKNGRYPEGSITAPVMASASPEASTP
ncbi:Peptidoglycan L-alanyl-D-glutamate endopeptidase CwlK precursor [compost metagenome]